MGKPIRVLHYGPVVGAGGVGTFVINLYREIDRDKVQFDFMQHYEPEGNDKIIADEIRAMGGRIFVVPMVRQHPFMARKHMKEIILNSGINILHCDVTLITQLMPEKIAYSAGIPTIVHSHAAGRVFGESIASNILHGDFYAVADNLTVYTHRINQKRISKYNCSYFACSKKAGVAMFGQQEVDKNNVNVLHNAIQVENFIYDASKARQVKTSLGIQNRLIVGHIGRFDYAKNHIFLIDIFKKINDINQNAVLLLVGDGETRQKIEAKVALEGLTDSVMFLGSRGDVPDLLQAMDILMLPSHYEGLPLVLIEAQASGLPCIVSDAVTTESDITNLCKFISLQKPAEYWAAEVLKYASSYERRNTYEDICNAGYDAKESARKMTKYYCAFVKNKSEESK